jgi:hypothetical protein
MPSIIRSQLVLPVPPHLPLSSFTAAELKPAVHKAVLRERNLSSPFPRLYSCNHIRWPYAFPSTALDQFPNPLKEEPLDVVWMHLTHPNGKWLFLVSANNVLRILNLEKGTLMWEERFGPAQLNSRVAFAVDFRGDIEARVAMVVLQCNQEYNEEEEEDDSTDDNEDRDPVLHVLNVIFDADKALVKMEPLMERHLDIAVIYLDIAGDHIGLIEDCDSGSNQSHGAGRVHLFNWQKNTFVDLPSVRNHTLHGHIPD